MVKQELKILEGINIEGSTEVKGGEDHVRKMMERVNERAMRKGYNQRIWKAAVVVNGMVVGTVDVRN